jgi:3-methyladenine DNA glycosylase AlkD
MGTKHDLMHKSIGWMLRETGKRNQELLVEFLETHKAAMPRTMFRYAIERLPR